ncbi:MAG: tyrosine--tRNA ligase [Candidatus Saccharibacteria bacterium]|nr:tyrosine--tRNA ligase [Candidatus Saccharibacteria bacterium]
MKLSEELVWRGFNAETTIKDFKQLDERESKKFYFGADPSADSLTIGNLAALMMCACFVRHGYEPTLLAGGATGQIGDPKENGERDLKTIEEVEHNKACIAKQMAKIISADGAADTKDDGRTDNDNYELRMVDNYDWFKDISYLSFLREVGKAFSMTQLLDRKFIQNRIGEGGSGISYAEFSYTLIQGYDFLHLYREYGIDLQLCGADQYGNCSSGIHLIRRLENAEADVWSTPLVIDPVTGRKFGKSEGNAIWLASSDNGSGNFTPVFDFYQFWVNQPDESVEYLLKIYTVYDKETIEGILAEHAKAPEKRVAQKALARGATEVVHGKSSAKAAETLTELLFGGKEASTLTPTEIESVALLLPVVQNEDGINVVDALVESGLVASKNEAKKMISGNAISINGEKVTDENYVITSLSILKRGKNKFALVK